MLQLKYYIYSFAVMYNTFNPWVNGGFFDRKAQAIEGVHKTAYSQGVMYVTVNAEHHTPELIEKIKALMAEHGIVEC